MRMPSLKDVSRASKQVATYSAMNPILWKTALCFPVGVGCSVIAPEPLNYFILAVSSLPVIVGSYGFVLFAHKNADRLQSEKHIENLQMLARIGRESSDPLLLSSDGNATNEASSRKPQ